MATLSDNDIWYAVQQQMKNKPKFRANLVDAIENNTKAVVIELVEKAVKKIFGVIIEVGGRIFQRIRDWLGF